MYHQRSEAKISVPAKDLTNICTRSLTTVSLRLGYGAGALSFGDGVSKRRWRCDDGRRARFIHYLFTGVLSLSFQGRASHLSLLHSTSGRLCLRLVRPALLVHLAIQGEF